MLMARLGVLSYLARRACSCSGNADAGAATRIHVGVGWHDVDIGIGLPHQGRAILQAHRTLGVTCRFQSHA